MKNEKDFKKRISEIAARIAEQDGPNKPEPDAERVKELLSDMGSRLETPLRAIEKASEFRDVIKGMIAMMPNLREPAVRSALNSVLTSMSKEKADVTPSKGISKKAPNAAYDGMPVPKELQGQLKETYERIKKK